MLGLDIAYMHAKSDNSIGSAVPEIWLRFSRSGDMVDAHQNINGSRDLTMHRPDQILILCPSLRIRGQLPASFVNNS